MQSTPMFTVTFIRHGESTDNLLPIWAGWRDAPLSEKGIHQVTALGASLSQTRLDVIHASPLKRAFSTAEAIQTYQAEPKPLLHTSLLLREQTRGVAEGHPWLTEPIPALSLEEHYAKGLYPIHHERWQKFPEGESLDDLAQRARRAVEEVVMPHIWEAIQGKKTGAHVAIASHGLLIAEMIPTLLKKGVTSTGTRENYKGMLNTAWIRVTVDTIEDEKDGEDTTPPLIITVTDFNIHAHLDDTKADSTKATTSRAVDAVQMFSGEGILTPPIVVA